MSVLAVIPARYAATRFPGKPLATIAGKPMIQHVYERAARAKRVREVLVATDDQRIADVVKSFKGVAVMTNPAARSGTERAAEVARTRKDGVIINVQGDEPLIEPDMLDQLADYLSQRDAAPMASLMKPLTSEAEGGNPNVVKVVVDSQSFAMYFSRAAIPFVRESSRKPLPRFYKHLGIYGYQRSFLLEFPALTPTTLEELEQLEQLRALEHGYRIKLLETTFDTIGVDTPEDLTKAEQKLLAQGR
jgi:3-deoxy-manno-octulosonate cytidylyltransferase (CMP-KDO synthetase)